MVNKQVFIMDRSASIDDTLIQANDYYEVVTQVLMSKVTESFAVEELYNVFVSMADHQNKGINYEGKVLYGFNKVLRRCKTYADLKELSSKLVYAAINKPTSMAKANKEMTLKYQGVNLTELGNNPKYHKDKEYASKRMTPEDVYSELLTLRLSRPEVTEVLKNISLSLGAQGKDVELITLGYTAARLHLRSKEMIKEFLDRY